MDQDVRSKERERVVCGKTRKEGLGHVVLWTPSQFYTFQCNWEPFYPTCTPFMCMCTGGRVQERSPRVAVVLRDMGCDRKE